MDDKYSEPKDYNKLVRNKVIEYIQNQGKEVTFHIATSKERYPKAMEKLKEELEELKEAIQAMERAHREPEPSPKNLAALKKDVHNEIADIFEIRNTIIANFKGNMPREGINEINAAEKYVSSIFLKYNLEILEIFNMQDQRRETKGGFSERKILERS